TCSYCGVGCSLDVNTKDGQVVNITPSRTGSANNGHTCVKGRFAHQFAHAPDRLRTPLIPAGRLPVSQLQYRLSATRRRSPRSHGTANRRTSGSAPRGVPARSSGARRCHRSSCAGP
ncbi:MAG: hypothetical protein HOC77_10205, partial [Chloroflexi bacterium]|nr:hypothetical protein [Chloroflexota bacterium]